ncbi:GAF domain-containing protein [Stappia sp.]|uniref:GAF domain-containing protein n=1 Tax=Stappia sp. TaxID=1870903 RepID=UPI0032D95CBE
MKDDEEISSLHKNVYKLENDIENLYLKNLLSFAYRAMSIYYINSIKRDGIDIFQLKEIFNEILSMFYLEGDKVFGFKISEKWNVGVYLFNEDIGVLQSVWRHRANGHPSTGLGRDWLPGEGHVGKAFLDRRPILTGNANDEAVAQLCRARNSKQLPYDSSAYISFASVPIAISGKEEENPFGVLVVTSDQEGRFYEESTTELLMHAAETLALIFELSDIDMSCLLSPNHNIVKNEQGD